MQILSWLWRGGELWKSRDYKSAGWVKNDPCVTWGGESNASTIAHGDIIWRFALFGYRHGRYRPVTRRDTTGFERPEGTWGKPICDTPPFSRRGAVWARLFESGTAQSPRSATGIPTSYRGISESAELHRRATHRPYEFRGGSTALLFQTAAVISIR